MRNALLLGLIACVSCSAPVAEPSPVEGLDALKFTVTLDRQDYIHREGIFADWRLTNEGRSRIDLVGVAGFDDVSFSVRNEQQKLTELGLGGTHCAPLREKFYSLSPGESLHGSIDLYNSFAGWSGPGQYTLVAKYFAATKNGDAKIRRIILHPEGEFTIHRPHGDDAVAANLIVQGMKRQATDDENEDTGPFLLNWHGGVRNDLINQAKSQRFAALAHLVSGQQLLPDWRLPGEFDADWQMRSEWTASVAEQHFLACLQSDGASPYMKALAYYELVRLAKLMAPRVPRHEVIRMAQALNREFPNTFMAWQMTRILDQMQESYK